MKFTCQKVELEHAMARIDAIVPGRDMQTLLSNVLLSIESNKVNITASDMESTVRIQVQATDTDGGELIVKARKLTEVAKQLISEDIKFTAESGTEENKSENGTDSFIVKLIGTGQQAAKFKMTGSDRSHFPNLAQIPDTNLSAIPSGLISEMINKTFYSISQEDNRYIYNGLCFAPEGNQLTVIGTDGRRLAAVTRELPSPISLGDGGSDIVVHAKAVRELLRIIDVSEEVKLGVEQRDIFFRVGNAELSSRLLEGKFPEYGKVIPKTSDIKIEVDREMILNAFRQVMVMTEPPSFQIRLVLEKSNLLIKANTPEVGEAEISVPVDYNDDLLEIGFNATYFTDILKNLSCTRMRLEFSDSTKPVVLYDLDDPDFIALIMPMKI